MADWQAGDLALCVLDGVNTRVGQCFTVIDVCGPVFGRGYKSIPPGEVTALLFAEVRHPRNPRGVFTDRRFRKVTPPAADEWDRETIALMNGDRVPAPAARGLVSQGGGR